MSPSHEPDLFDELPILSEIGSELERILAASEHDTRLHRAWRTVVGWRGPRLLVLAGAIAVAGTGGALAASGVLFGSPVKPTGPLVATAGEGIPLPGGSRLLPLRVPDPAGGLPWGMRVVRTTRSQLCVQIGRVADGQLGELGIDGSFGNDGRFHPLPAGNLATLGTCNPPSGTYSDLIIGGDASAGDAPRRRPSATTDRRIISFGLLGTDAVSLTYMTGGAPHTLTPIAALGAYLIVQPYSSSNARADGACTGCTVGSGGNNGDSLPYPQTDPAPPDGAVRSITYRLGGHTCVDNDWSGDQSRSAINAQNNLIVRFRRSCGLSEGPLPKGPALPDVRAALTAHLQTRGHVMVGAEVAFRSPIAITKADQQYTATVRLGSSNFGYQFADFTGTDQNITRGSIVAIPIERLLASAASRTVTIEVDYLDNLPGYPNEHATMGTITIHEPAGTRPAPLPYRHAPPKIQQRTLLLGLNVPDPAGGPPWGAEIVLRQPFFLRGSGGVNGNVEFGRLVNHTIGLIGVAGAFGNDRRFHTPDATNWLAGFSGTNVSGTVAQPDLASMNHWDYTIPSTVNAEHYCTLCTNNQLRTLVAGYAGIGTTIVTLTGHGLHETERLSPDDHGIYLFVITGRWKRQTRYTVTANCSDGTLSSGPASSNGDTGKPFCPA